MLSKPDRVEHALPRIPLRDGARVFGDLHLDVEDASAVERFVAWLESDRTPRQWICLGDLFEYWIGGAQAASPGGLRVQRALAAKLQEGWSLDVIPGNRDFLLGAAFERATGARVRHGGLLGTLAGRGDVLFVHGDELATRDRAYQRLRWVLRSATLRRVARFTPHAVARALARRLRRVSRLAVARKPSAAKEMQADAAEALLATQGAELLVCGHAHRFRDERLAAGRWLVVDAFGGARDTVEFDAEGNWRVRASHGPDLSRSRGPAAESDSTRAAGPDRGGA